MASFQYDHLFEGPVSKYSLTLKYRELGLQHHNFEGGTLSPHSMMVISINIYYIKNLETFSQYLFIKDLLSTSHGCWQHLVPCGAVGLRASVFAGYWSQTFPQHLEGACSSSSSGAP